MEANSYQIVKATALESSVVNVVDLTPKDENIPVDLTDKFERGEDVAPLRYNDEIDEVSDSERWESESLYEDALEGIGNEQYTDGSRCLPWRCSQWILGLTSLKLQIPVRWTRLSPFGDVCGRLERIDS